MYPQPLGEFIQERKKSSLQFWRNPKITIPVFLTTSILAACRLSYNNEVFRSHTYPIAFSEKHELEDSLTANGNPVPVFTDIFTSGNEAIMKGCEAQNIAYDLSSQGKASTIASEFENKWYKKQDSTNAVVQKRLGYEFHHYSLPQLLDSIPIEAQRAIDALQPFLAARDGLVNANGDLEGTWEYTHTDFERTEYYDDKETYTENGKTHTRTVRKSRQVYDHTDHQFTYNPVKGQVSSQRLDTQLSEISQLVIPEIMPVAKHTHAENEEAIEKYIGRIKKKKDRMTPQELLFYAARWNSGSTYVLQMPGIIGHYDALHPDADTWRQQMHTAHNYFDSNGHRIIDGPIEYQTIQHTLGDTRAVINGVDKIVGGLQLLKEKAPVLKSLYDHYIAIGLDREKGDPQTVLKEIRALNEQLYSANYEGALEMQRFRGGMIALWGFVGAAAGLVGVGAYHFGLNFFAPEDKRRKRIVQNE